ncbi:alpha/beta fold hydrolase [Rhodobacteraceae bacterium 2CG4]|uniref:Alpha/beta fold hydrolase n=1 Tax=Halovulum marinum TaxID=2662447 RepID=A0A6L5Z4T9_9RHOB|nr:alpha/beta hydrolase [Halovulum marinum]MSU91120.1 alpha/beta fold hydrolase [Halovulum marinum]
MSFFAVSDDTELHYNHAAASEGQPTVVFVNSSGARAAVWEEDIVPGLVAHGVGTLTVDFRGQGQTRYGPDSRFDQAEIVTDLEALIGHLGLRRIVLAGLSIGGLHAARLWEAGVNCEAIVFVNTLRKKGPLTEWIAELEHRLMDLGGERLLHDAFRPVTVSTTQLGNIRPRFLTPEPYAPLPVDHPRNRISHGSRHVDWGFPWAKIDIPVLVMTGLHDRLFRVQADVDEIVASIPRVEVIEFPDEGHALHTENPGRFVDEMLRFIGRVSQ